MLNCSKICFLIGSAEALLIIVREVLSVRERDTEREIERETEVTSPFSGRLTSGSRPGQAVPSPFCQRIKDEGKL